MKQHTQAERPRLNPVQAEILRAKWNDQAISDAIHALMAADLHTLMDRAGSLFFVVLHASQGTNSTDRRTVIDGLRDLTDLTLPGTAAQQDQRKRSVWRGLKAAQRMAPALDPLRIAHGNIALLAINGHRAVHLADFPA